jgi:Nif11 domain
MLSEPLTRFRLLVLQDQSLQNQLRDLDDRDEFIVRAIELGRLHDYDFTEADVNEAMQAGRRAWLERWI